MYASITRLARIFSLTEARRTGEAKADERAFSEKILCLSQNLLFVSEGLVKFQCKNCSSVYKVYGPYIMYEYKCTSISEYFENTNKLTPKYKHLAKLGFQLKKFKDMK
ncbi:hypothetical protein ABPG72_017774 [Tetrahymena utriculariae]